MPRRTPPRLTVPISEAVFSQQVIALARLQGWEVYHPWLSINSAAGWPDLALCRPPRLLLAELKSERGTATPAQRRWLELVDGCTVAAHLWRPSDWEMITRALARITEPKGDRTGGHTT